MTLEIGFHLDKKKNSDMEQNIQLKHPKGKKAITMETSKYDTLKNALMNYLKKKGVATHSEICEAVIEDFKKNRIKFEGSIPWHIEWVKLDLEAKNEIKRIANTSPLKFSPT